MNDTTPPRYLFSTSTRFTYWANVILIVLLVTGGWYLRLTTNVINQPGGEGIAGPILVGQIFFGMFLAATSLAGWKEISPGQRVAGVLLGAASFVNAFLFNMTA